MPNVSSKLIQQITSGASRAIPVLGQANLGKQILGSISKQALGYDFIGLVTKIGFFYVAAFLLIKYFEAVIFGSGIVKTIGALAGINLNPALPDSVIKFFKDGIEIQKANPAKNIPSISLMPWDVVNLIAFFLLVSEATTYFHDNQKAGGKKEWFVIGIWGLLIGSFGLMAILPIVQKLKGGKHMTAADFAAKFNVPVTTNYDVTILIPQNNQTTSFVMTSAQIVSLPQNVYVTAGPKVSMTQTPTLTDAMFTQLFGVPVVAG